jgi:hypothetical protein
MRRRRSHTGLVLAGVVVILAGFAIALVEAYKLPKGTIWVVVVGTIGLVGVIRWLTRR